MSINLKALHELVCHSPVEVELGVVKGAKEWLGIATNTQDRICLAISTNGQVYFTVRNFKDRKDLDIKVVEMHIEEGQSVIDKLFSVSSRLNRHGDMCFPLAEIKTVFDGAEK